MLWSIIGGSVMLLATGFFLWLLDFGDLDWDDHETKQKIIAEAIDWNKLQFRGKQDEQLAYAPNEQMPYTGWAKQMLTSTAPYQLAQFKDGKQHGVSCTYGQGGKIEGNWKEGKQDGLWIYWDGDRVSRKAKWKDGEPVGWGRNAPENSPFPSIKGEEKENAARTKPVVEKWAEWEADPEPYGGLKVLAKIKEAKQVGNSLSLDGNKITDISPLKCLTKSMRLSIGSNQITDISPLKGLNKLMRLHMANNQITDLSPLKGLTGVRTLSLDGNKISDISPLKGLGIEQLYLSNNKISDISPLNELPILRWLALSSNPISDLSPLKGLTNLTLLYLEDIQIADLSPLKDLTKLETIDLSNNKISDLSPLKDLTKLETIDLSNNKISDLSPLKGLTNLKQLQLNGNPIPEDQKAMIKKALPDHYIIEFD